MLLPQSFYDREDVVLISKQLLGKRIETDINGIVTSALIVETEAYKAPEDKASHAHNNRRTGRTEVMFGPPGHAYVYLCYGIHKLFNIVTAGEGTPHAVLIRAVEPVEGTDYMLLRRGMNALSPQVTAGPGALSKAMGIGLAHTGTPLYLDQSQIRISDAGLSYPDSDIIESARVGVGYAKEWASVPWRFRLKNSAWTSKAL